MHFLGILPELVVVVNIDTQDKSLLIQVCFTHNFKILIFQTQGRESIAAKLVANLITEAGANRVLACDLHSGQSMGYFDIPVDHVYGQVRNVRYLHFFYVTIHIQRPHSLTRISCL